MYVDKVLKAMRHGHHFAYNRMAKAVLRQKHYYDVRVDAIQYEPGDSV